MQAPKLQEVMNCELEDVAGLADYKGRPNPFRQVWSCGLDGLAVAMRDYARRNYSASVPEGDPEAVIKGDTIELRIRPRGWEPPADPPAEPKKTAKSAKE